MTLPSLEELFEYQHPRLIERFKKDFPPLADRADELFKDVLKFLWLSQKHKIERARDPENLTLNFSLMMYDEMRDVDSMWHTFIIFTKDYADFCSRYFGEFMHHNPEAVDLLPQSRDDYARDLEKYLSYVYDHFGADTLSNWFKIEPWAKAD